MLIQVDNYTLQKPTTRYFTGRNYRLVTEIGILQKCFLNDPQRKILTKERKETFKI